MKREKIKVNRTKEGTAFEIAFVVLAVVAWVFIVLMLSLAPDVVATHFDSHGRPNAYGSPWGLLIPCGIVTIAGAFMMVGAYFPHILNVPVEVNSPRQYELLIRMTRIGALIMLMLAPAIPATVLAFKAPTPWLIVGIIALLFVDIIYYCIRIRRCKQQ